MSNTVIKVENLWKQYRYGAISHAILRKDFQSWWARMRGKEDLKKNVWARWGMWPKKAGRSCL